MSTFFTTTRLIVRKFEEKDLEKVFERFYRVENEAHTVKGTGIGLNLVKTAIEVHHNGKIFVTSKIGEGSTFGFRLPINPQPEEDEEKSTDEMPVKSPELLAAENNGNDGWEISFEKH